MEALPPLFLELIAKHLVNSYGPSDPMIAVARSRPSPAPPAPLLLTCRRAHRDGAARPDGCATTVPCPAAYPTTHSEVAPALPPCTAPLPTTCLPNHLLTPLP